MWKRFEGYLLILAAAAAMTVILLNLEFNLLEANLYDFRVTHGKQSPPDSNIVLVTLDDESAKRLDEFPPLPLDVHTQFVEALEKLKPKAVGYLIDFNQVNQVNPELFVKEWGKRFVDSVTRMQASGTPVLLGTSYDGIVGEIVPPYPLSSLPHALAVIHKDGNVFSQDKITRRALTHLHDKASFHIELAQRLGHIPSGPRGGDPPGTFYVKEGDMKYFFFRYHGDTSLKAGYSESNLPYSRVSFAGILKGEVAPEWIQGKIVLIGTLFKEDSMDYAFTPYAKVPYTNPKIVVHANILDSIMHNEGVVRPPEWTNWLLTFSTSGFVIGWVMNSTPLYGVFATLGLTAILVILGQLLFQHEGIWIRESQPLIGIFLGYYLVVPYRLIQEYKKRWDYQKKNDLLTQVEELKRNFLSLVTHDLKTPVARIQGLAEVLLRKNPDQLLDGARDTVHHIIRSTEELNRFISSILELSKFESNRLQLTLESKDLNQLIERLIEGFEAQVRAKGILIRSNLEPLFPIKIDATLITKVISNLIDNAIKYSPPGSQIEIESKEEGHWVVITVKDHGIGMSAQDRERLFTRFYRVKNDATVNISGTGLGLYLTKYFIEAHQGRVEVESTPAKGSTFKIYLPVEGVTTTTPGLPIVEVEADVEKEINHV